MRASFLRPALLALGFAVILSSAAPARTESPDGRPFRKILVIAIHPELEARKEMENRMARGIGSRGAEAVACHVVLPEARDESARDQVVAYLKANGFDAAVVTRLTARFRDVKSYRPGGLDVQPVAGWYSMGQFYYEGQRDVKRKEKLEETVTYEVETRVFDPSTENQVWVSAKKLTDPKSRPEAMDTLASFFVKQMAKAGLF